MSLFRRSDDAAALLVIAGYRTVLGSLVLAWLGSCLLREKLESGHKEEGGGGNDATRTVVLCHHQEEATSSTCR